MKILNLNKKFAFLGLLLLLLLTYFRENFLLEINASLASDVFHRSNSYWLSDFFKNMTNDFLVRWKWGLTVFFSLLMSIVTLLSLYVWFKSISVLKIVGIFYFCLLFVLCLFAIIGYLTHSFNDIYFVLRKIVGVVQSPLPFFAFFTLFYWNFKNSQIDLQPYSG